MTVIKQGDSFEPVLAAIKAIRAKHGKERGVSGTIECPACKGQLQYSIARYNGHIHGRCACGVGWMQ